MQRRNELRLAGFFAAFATALFVYAHARGFSIAAFADDVGVIRVAAQEAADGGVLAAALAKWLEALAPGGTMWRPLPVLSFALDAYWHGDQVPIWRVTNVALHFLSAVATGAIVRAFGQSLLAASLAFGMFLLLPWVPEVSLWIVGRYDGFATLFVLLSIWLALGSTGRDARTFWSLLAAFVAYASKESAATALGLIALVLWLRDCQRNGSLFTRPSLTTVRISLAHGVLLAAYLGWRHWLFQSVSLDLYATGAPSRGIAAGVTSWLSHLTSARDYIDLAPIAAAVVGLILVGTVLSALRRREHRFALVAGAAVTALVAAALAVVFPSPNTGADGARIYHLMSAGLALAGGVALAAQSPRLRIVLALVVLSSLAVWQRSAVEEWRLASNQMYRLQSEFPRLGNTLAANEYALIVAPDHLGRVPFARNANGALLLAYSGDRERISQMIISTDLGVWEWWKLSTEGAVRKYLTKRPDAPVAPRSFVCFNGESLQNLGSWESASQAEWDERWRAALARTCPNLRYGR